MRTGTNLISALACLRSDSIFAFWRFCSGVAPSEEDAHPMVVGGERASEGGEVDGETEWSGVPVGTETRA